MATALVMIRNEDSGKFEKRVTEITGANSVDKYAADEEGWTVFNVECSWGLLTDAGLTPSAYLNDKKPALEYPFWTSLDDTGVDDGYPLMGAAVYTPEDGYVYVDISPGGCLMVRVCVTESGSVRVVPKSWSDVKKYASMKKRLGV